MLDDYAQFGGSFPESAALHHVLAHHQVTNPMDGHPFTEAMLFGLEGGIGMTYLMVELPERPPHLALSTTHLNLPQGAERINMDCRLHETEDETVIAEALAEGTPVIAWVDPAALPTNALPKRLVKWLAPRPIVIFGWAEDEVRFAHTSTEPFTIEKAAFTTAWSGSAHIVIPGTPPEDLETVVMAAIFETAQTLLEASDAGLEAWAELLNDEGSKGWKQLYGDGADLFDGLLGLYKTGTRGGYRSRMLYADFLEEAVDTLGLEGLRAPATRYRRVAEEWIGLGDLALPGAGLFGEARDLIDRRAAIFKANGAEALPHMRKIDARLAEIKAEMDGSLPVKDPAALREGLAGVIRSLAQVERSAAQALLHAAA